MQVVEDGYEFFARRHLVTLFSAPNYCGEFDNAGAMMSVDDTLMCSFQASSAGAGVGRAMSIVAMSILGPCNWKIVTAEKFHEDRNCVFKLAH